MYKNLLVIDDDPLHHRLVDIFIQEFKPDIKHKSFLDALDALLYINTTNQDSSPDLILLDLQMPLLSGWGFIELFEAIGPGLEKQTDIIILTSSVDPADKDKAATFECVKGLFSKPCSERLLEDIFSSPFISINKKEG